MQTEQSEGVALVRLHRPEVLNALDRKALASLTDTVERLAASAEVRAIVITGGSRAFCTGEDLREAATLDRAAFADQMATIQRLATALRHAPKPTIAAVAGPAFGGGLEIAVNCDARVAAPSARFACPEIGWGLTITNGASVLLRQLVGDGWARELTLFGTELDADAALRTGLVTRVVPAADLEALALGMAQRAAEQSPHAIRATKRLLNADPRGWQETLDAEAVVVVDGFGNETTRARLASFAARRRDRT